MTWLTTHIDEIDEVGASEADSRFDLGDEQHDSALVERQALPWSALERGGHTAAQCLVRVLTRQAASEQLRGVNSLMCFYSLRACMPNPWLHVYLISYVYLRVNTS